MIFTDRTITVRKGESRIDEPIVVYRGDYELEVRFTILNSRFKFMSGTNMIESEKASYGQLAILTPYGGNIFSDIVRCNDGSVTFVLTTEMLNQIEEVGLYSFQIRLMDYNKESRVSIPPIEFGIEVREPIASEDHDNSVNNAIVGYSIAKVVDPKEEKVGDTFDESGNYNKTDWETGDRISEGKLNKIEDAIDTINQNEKNNSTSLGKRIDSNFNVLNSIKPDKADLDQIQQQVNNLVLGATGDGNNPEVIQARGEYVVLNDRLTDNEAILRDVLRVANNAEFSTNGEIVNFELRAMKWDTSTNEWLNTSDRMTTVDGYHLLPGDIIMCDIPDIYEYHYIRFDEETNEYLGQCGWRSTPVTIAEDGVFYFTIRNLNGSVSSEDISIMRKAVRIIKKRTLAYDINKNTELIELKTKKDMSLECDLLGSVSDFVVDIGSLDNEYDNTIAHTLIPYTALDKYTCYINDESSNYLYRLVSDEATSNWKSYANNPLEIVESVEFNNRNIFVEFRKQDYSEMTFDDCLCVSSYFRIETDAGVINSLRSDIELIDAKLLEISYNLDGEFKPDSDLVFEYKMYGQNGWEHANHRVALETPITSLDVSDIISINDPNYLIAIYAFKNGSEITKASSSGWVSEYTVNMADIDIYIQVRKSDNSGINAVERDYISKIIRFNKKEGIINELETRVEYVERGLSTGYKNIIREYTFDVESSNYKIFEATPEGVNPSLDAFIFTNNMTGEFADYICLRQRLNANPSNLNGNRSNAIYIGNGVYKIEGFNYVTDCPGNIVQFFIDLRTLSNGLHVESVIVQQKVEGLTVNEQTLSNGDVVLYVAPDGNDDNSGLSPSTPLATIKNAISKGATTILCKRGVYYNQPAVNASNMYGKRLSIMPYENNTYDAATNPDRPLIRFVYANELNNLETSNGLLSQPLNVNTHLDAVFISRTKEPIDTSNQRSVGYNSTVWQIHDDESLDTKLKPVLSLSDCRDEQGTFFYDGNNIYINPLESNYTKFMIPDGTNAPFILTGYSELTLQDIVVEYGQAQNFRLRNNMNMTLRNCHSRYTMTSDGFSLDNSNCNLYNCSAFKSRNDGFNIHNYGESNFYNCIGYYNYDDGISHHDGCIGIIDGGEWHHNGKGGISSPTYGSYVDIYNVYSHDNNYGIYGASDNGHRQCKARIFNSVLMNNERYDLMLEHIEAKIYNTRYTTKQSENNVTLIEL